VKRSTPLRRDGDGARRFADQRSELKRTEIRRATPATGLPRSTLKPTRQRMRQRSEARSELMREVRVPYIQQLAEIGVGCEIGMVFAEAGIDSGCTGKLEGLHERRKRSAGGSLLNHANLIPACNRCNGHIEDQPGEVRLLTGTALVLREGDPEWELMGRRSDRYGDDHDDAEAP